MSPTMSFISNTAENGQVFISAFVNGKVLNADDTHPNFRSIQAACAGLMDPDDEGPTPDEFEGLFDIPRAIERAFARLSDRVTVKDNTVLFDGDPAQPALSNQILRFMDEGRQLDPLVNFMERIENNPEPHSREQAFEWLNNHDFTITEDGYVIAYKGVNSDGNGGYQSGWAGHAFVNDVEYNGVCIPYAVGDTVTMPRSEVMHDPHAACHAGLHVGTYAYALSYSRSGVMLKVLIDPRDIVSVPHAGHGQKIRVCRFVIDSIIDAPITTALDAPAPFEAIEDQGVQFKEGDTVVCTYWDYGVGNVVAVDEDGDLWVNFEGAVKCMGDGDVKHAHA